MTFISLRSQWIDRVPYLYPVLKHLKYFNGSSISLCIQRQGQHHQYFLVIHKCQELEVILQLIYLIQTSHLTDETSCWGGLQGYCLSGAQPPGIIIILTNTKSFRCAKHFPYIVSFNYLPTCTPKYEMDFISIRIFIYRWGKWDLKRMMTCLQVTKELWVESGFSPRASSFTLLTELPPISSLRGRWETRWWLRGNISEGTDRSRYCFCAHREGESIPARPSHFSGRVSSIVCPDRGTTETTLASVSSWCSLSQRLWKRIENSASELECWIERRSGGKGLPR